MPAIQEPAPLATPAPPSNWKMMLQCYCALMAALVCGMAAFAVMIFSSNLGPPIRTYIESNYTFESGPPDDTALSEWALKRPGSISFKSERAGNNLRTDSEFQAFGAPRPSFGDVMIRMRELGYDVRGMHGGSMGVRSNLYELSMDARVLGVTLAGTQVGFGIIGAALIAWAARKRRPLPPLFAGSHGRSILLGAGGGLALLCIGTLYSFGLEKVLGHAPPSPWDSSHAMSLNAKFVFLLFGVIGAPIAEEIFFRGYVFGKFKAAGRVWLGILFSSFLFAGAHFSDIYNVPIIFLYGVLLAWMFHRTSSLLTSMTAHGINNGVMILWMILS